MKFTDRFIKIPIKIYDRQKADLLDKIEYEDSWMKINPFEISHYKVTSDKDDNADVPSEYIFCTMKQGDAFFVYLSPEEFEKLLNDFQK